MWTESAIARKGRTASEIAVGTGFRISTRWSHCKLELVRMANSVLLDFAGALPQRRSRVSPNVANWCPTGKRIERAFTNRPTALPTYLAYRLRAVVMSSVPPMMARPSGKMVST